MTKAVLIDITGVLTDGAGAIAGSADAIRRLETAGLPFRLITNTTRRPKRRLLADLAAAGFDIAPEAVFTPAQAAVDFLRRRGLSAYLLIHPDLAEDFASLPAGGAPAVVIGDAGRHFDYRRLNAAFRMLVDGAEFVALAANRRFRDSDGKLSMDAGAFVEALAFASEVSPTVLGKPAKSFFAMAAHSLGCALSDIAMIGDDVEADVAGALRAGIGRAFLVRTGKYTGGDEHRVKPPPTATLPDLAAVISRILG